MTTECVVCGKPSVGFVQTFQNRKKVASSPVCLEHYLIASALIGLGQDKVRTFLTGVFPVKKGSIPRFKVSTSR